MSREIRFANNDEWMGKLPGITKKKEKKKHLSIVFVDYCNVFELHVYMACFHLAFRVLCFKWSYCSDKLAASLRPLLSI